MTGAEDIFDDEVLAAEYALHLLDAEARHAFESRMRIDQNLRTLVVAWEARLAPIAAEIAPVEPPAQIKALVVEAVSGPKLAQASTLSKFWALFLGATVVVAMAGLLVVSSLFQSAPDPGTPSSASISAISCVYRNLLVTH